MYFSPLPLDVTFFRKWLGRYRLEHIQAKACPMEKDLGLILVDTNTLKAQLLPSPIKCLEVRSTYSVHVITEAESSSLILELLEGSSFFLEIPVLKALK